MPPRIVTPVRRERWCTGEIPSVFATSGMNTSNPSLANRIAPSSTVVVIP